MTEKIRLALELYEQDPEGAAQSLQALIEEDQTQFVRAAAALRTEGDSPGFQPLIKLLAQSNGVIRQLCDPGFLDKESSIDLVKRIAAIEPALDSTLVRLLPGRGWDSSDPAQALAAERVLELLGAISVSNRIVPMLAHLIQHPNPRLRAKVSLLIARWTRNVRMAEDRLDETDARVRANAVEGLWGDKTGRATSVLWRAVNDADNRVVGNALFGLYELRDQKIIPYIVNMATHEKPKFRATAAWTMGQTRDPQFLSALETLTHDLYAAVRKCATRAMGQIRKVEDAEATSDAISQNQ
jgi:HEAT repeat protein